MKKDRLAEYEWDERSETATLTYESGNVTTKHQPLASTTEDGYWGNLFIWLRLDGRL